MSANQKTLMPSIEAKIVTLNNDIQSKVKAFASIIIGKSFVITGVKILDLGKGLCVGMPCKRYINGDEVKYREVCHPITKETHEEMTKAVLNAYFICLEEETLQNQVTY